MHRIQHGRIASLAHPNVAGAFQWSGLAMERLQRHRAMLTRISRGQQARLAAAAPAPAARLIRPPALPSLDADLRRYNLRSSRSLAADAGHLEVDSLALLVTTAADSDRNLAEPVSLVVYTKGPSTRVYLLTFRPYLKETVVFPGPPGPTRPAVKPYPYFEPGVVNRFTVAVAGDLFLTDIVGCSIALGENPYKNTLVKKSSYGLIWRPQQVILEVNGRQVATRTPFGQKFRPLDHLDLGWPAPAALQRVAVQAPPQQTAVRPFPKKTEASMDRHRHDDDGRGELASRSAERHRQRGAHACHDPPHR